MRFRIAAARLQAPSHPTNSQFCRPSAIGRRAMAALQPVDQKRILALCEQRAMADAGLAQLFGVETRFSCRPFIAIWRASPRTSCFSSAPRSGRL